MSSKTITEYINIAEGLQNPYDQDGREAACMSTARQAAQRGEISRDNIRFLADRIYREWEAADAKAAAERKAAAEAAFKFPVVLEPLRMAVNAKKRELEVAGWGDHSLNLAVWHIAVDATKAAVIRGDWDSAREFARAGDSAVIPGNYSKPVAEKIGWELGQVKIEAFTGQKTVTRHGGYVSHEDSFGGLSGGDYSSWEEDSPEFAAVKAEAEEIKRQVIERLS